MQPPRSSLKDSTSIREARRLSLESTLFQWIIVAFSYVATSNIVSSYFASRQWREISEGLVQAGVLQNDPFSHENLAVNVTEHALWIVAWCALWATLLICCTRANTECANCMSCSFSCCFALKMTLVLTFLVLVASWLPQGAKQVVNFSTKCDPTLPEYSNLCSGENQTRCMMCYDMTESYDDDWDIFKCVEDKYGKCFPKPSMDSKLVDYCNSAGPKGTPFESPLPAVCAFPSLFALNCPNDEPFPILNDTLTYEDYGAVLNWFQDRPAPDSWTRCNATDSEAEYRLQADEHLLDMVTMLSHHVVHAVVVQVMIQLVALALFVKVFVNAFSLWREERRAKYGTVQDVSYEAVPVKVKPYTTGGLIHQQELV